MSRKRSQPPASQPPPPRPWQPLVRVPISPTYLAAAKAAQDFDENRLTVWCNDQYEVIAHEYLPGQVHLSIKRYDRKPTRNWRHMQQMKNEICGSESEGIELFPAESRLIDEANQFHLYVLLNPPEPGDCGTLTDHEGRQYADLLIIPRKPDGMLAVGAREGRVSTDDQVEQFNADREAGKHKGRQRPWQPGLTTGRLPQTPYVADPDADEVPATG